MWIISRLPFTITSFITALGNDIHAKKPERSVEPMIDVSEFTDRLNHSRVAFTCGSLGLRVLGQ
jgi:hypothetical protein